jgi:hypothetical protein
MNTVTRFLDWYEKHIVKSLIVTAIILYLQIPHFVWGGDALLTTGLVYNVNPMLDFLLYGIDLLELIPIIGITIAIISKMRHKV